MNQSRIQQYATLGLVLAVALMLNNPSASLAAEEEARKPSMKGFCPVAYLQKQKAVEGKAAHQSTYRGDLFYFSSAEAKKLFDATPAKYAPAFAGWCAESLAREHPRRNLSDPKIFKIHEGRVYLFSNQDALKVFEGDPSGTIARARKQFAVSYFRGYCPASFQLLGRSLKGTSQYASVYRGFTYHFASPEARDAFLKDPGRYLPKYPPYCAVGMYEGAPVAANPRVFAVHKDRTYLFANREAKKKFEADPEKIIAKADDFWRRTRLRLPRYNR